MGYDTGAGARPVSRAPYPVSRIPILMRHIIVGTAGHIDHGKSALVLALTGTDPDRWEEEKRRGITIDLGFAHLDLGHDLRIGFIDGPATSALSETCWREWAASIWSC